MKNLLLFCSCRHATRFRVNPLVYSPSSSHRGISLNTPNNNLQQKNPKQSTSVFSGFYFGIYVHIQALTVIAHQRQRKFDFMLQTVTTRDSCLRRRDLVVSLFTVKVL